MMKTYQYRIGRESLKSRIPGLFPYIDFNSVGDAILHKATDSKVGCYNKIPQNIILPEGIGFEVDGETILESNTEYSYKTLMYYYYKYVDELDDNDVFKEFIETAIGKVQITSEKWYDEEKHDLVPEYTYLAIAKTQYNWFVRRKRLCEQYSEMKTNETHKECESDYCCKCDEYERMGGDNMLSLLKTLVDKAKKIAEEYYGYASNSNGVTINTHLLLTKSMQDVGVMTPMEEEWVAGDEYFGGDLVVYNNETYICTLDSDKSTTGKYNTVTEKIEFDTNSFTKIKEIGNELSSGNISDELNIKFTLIDDNDEYGIKFSITDREYYIYISDNDFVKIDKWAGNTDYESGTSYVVYNDTVYVCTETHTSDSSFNSGYFEKVEVTKNSANISYSEGDCVYIDVDNTDNDITVDGKVNSKLKSLRRFKDYINAYDEFETPGKGEDWLFYYREGVANYRVLDDDLGNVLFFYDNAGEWESEKGYTASTLTPTMVWHEGTLYTCVSSTDGTEGYFDYANYEKTYYYVDGTGSQIDEDNGVNTECYNLYAYGDVITDIRYEDNNDGRYKLIFEYVIGAHLKATYMGYDEDNDGNKLYKFANFQYDENDKYHGVKQVDTYYINTDSDIYTKLIQGSTDSSSDADSDSSSDSSDSFETYVTTSDNFGITKYEFSTDGNTTTETKLINNKTVVFPTIMSEFSATIENSVDYSYSNIFKEDYLNGISYKPTTDIDVNIQRGNASCFDRHIKLGEIKTLEDMENYANGGFYNIVNNG